MQRLRLALAQVNPTVGDIRGNSAIVHDVTAQAVAAGAHLIAFPEMMITGYPVEDLVFRESFVTASTAAVSQLADELATRGLGQAVVIVGYLSADGPARLGADRDPRTGPRNSVAVLHQGQIVATYAKHHLPNYGVFDEDRYFVPGEIFTIIRIGGIDLGLAICEDLWQDGGPFTAAAHAGVSLVISINGSPYELAKDDTRLAHVRRRAAEAHATVAYVNMVGGQDELVFDGGSMIVNPEGAVIAQAPRFSEYLLISDLQLPLANTATGQTHDDTTPAPDGMLIERIQLSDHISAPSQPLPSECPADDLGHEESVWNALVLGLRDYVRKNTFQSVILGLSGGIDSSVVAAIACDAIGPSHVVGVSMPSQYSSPHSLDDAADLAQRTGLTYRLEPIQPMVNTFLSGLSLSGIAVENLQARVRGVILMALSNQEGHLVLTTGNKSELAVGYSTLYGDSVGGFNPIKDVPKTLVWKLAEWRNAKAEQRGEIPPIPKNSIIKPPSAELRPGQLDTDSLPDYHVLDDILIGYIDGDLSRDDLVATGHDPTIVDKVIRMVDLAEYKRRQSAPGTKISIKSFGRDRRLPITNRFREKDFQKTC